MRISGSGADGCGSDSFERKREERKRRTSAKLLEADSMNLPRRGSMKLKVLTCRRAYKYTRRRARVMRRKMVRKDPRRA